MAVISDSSRATHSAHASGPPPIYRYDELVAVSSNSSTVPPPMVLRTNSAAEHALLYSQALFTLASKLRDGGPDVGPIRLVTLAL